MFSYSPIDSKNGSKKRSSRWKRFLSCEYGRRYGRRGKQCNGLDMWVYVAFVAKRQLWKVKENGKLITLFSFLCKGNWLSSECAPWVLEIFAKKEEIKSCQLRGAALESSGNSFKIEAVKGWSWEVRGGFNTMSLELATEHRRPSPISMQIPRRWEDVGVKYCIVIQTNSTSIFGSCGCLWLQLNKLLWWF